MQVVGTVPSNTTRAQLFSQVISHIVVVLLHVKNPFTRVNKSLCNIKYDFPVANGGIFAPRFKRIYKYIYGRTFIGSYEFSLTLNTINSLLKTLLLDR